MNEPINPIACHLGQGVVQLYTLPPENVTLIKYEVQVSKQLNGTYKRVGLQSTSDKDVFLFNFTPTTTAYIQIRAITGTQDNKITSNWVQVKKAIASKVTVVMRCRAVSGSIIPENALFVMPKYPGRVIGFRADNEVLIQ